MVVIPFKVIHGDGIFAQIVDFNLKKSGQQPCIWIWKDSYISELSLHILCVPCLCREKNSIGGLLPKRIVRSQDSLLQLQPNHQQSPFEASHRQQLVSWIKGWEVMNPRDEVAQRLRWATCSLLKRWPSMTTILTLNRINLEGQGVKRVNC